MRKWILVAALAAFGTSSCSSDDSAVTGGTGGQAGNAGNAGNAGSGGAGGTGSGGKAGAGGSGSSGAGTGGAGAGGSGGTGGSGMGGSGGTDVIPDPCAGKYHPLPFAVSSGFTTLRICSGGTCTSPPMPYFFNPIPNPNCDETFPDGGIVPPFADAATEGGSPSDPDAADAGTIDSGDPDAGTAGDGSGSDGGATSDVAEATDVAVTGDGAPMVDVIATADTGNVDVAAPDVSVTQDGATEASSDGRSTLAPDAGAPGCYEFLYNPACGANACWGGVIFTQSAGSMADPGLCIESGATKITFKAKASRPGARIKFGSIREGMGTTEFFINVTTDWAAYEVSIPQGEPYNSYSAGGTGVWNGFSVIVEPQDHIGGTYIFVKDAVWEK